VNFDHRKVRQAGAIAVRRADKRHEVCLVRKRSGKGWGIPKGIIEPRHTIEDTALKETWEEAGLKGRLVGEALGAYEAEKGGNTFSVVIFLMEVLEEHDEWPEADWRERRWTSFRKADALLEDHPVRPLLDRARDALDDR